MCAFPRRRLFYNYDAWGVFLWVKEISDIRKNIDLFAGSQVTAIMLCPNMGQSTVYPSKVSELCHWREQSPEDRAKFHHELGTLFAQASERVARLWREPGQGRAAVRNVLRRQARAVPVVS